MTARTLIGAQVPQSLLKDWLQHVRAFDAAHPGCHFKIGVDAPDMSTDEIHAMLRGIDPPFADVSIHPIFGKREGGS